MCNINYICINRVCFSIEWNFLLFNYLKIFIYIIYINLLIFYLIIWKLIFNILLEQKCASTFAKYFFELILVSSYHDLCVCVCICVFWENFNRKPLKTTLEERFELKKYLCGAYILSAEEDITITSTIPRKIFLGRYAHVCVLYVPFFRSMTKRNGNHSDLVPLDFVHVNRTQIHYVHPLCDHRMISIEVKTQWKVWRVACL